MEESFGEIMSSNRRGNAYRKGTINSIEMKLTIILKANERRCRSRHRRDKENSIPGHYCYAPKAINAAVAQTALWPFGVGSCDLATTSGYFDNTGCVTRHRALKSAAGL